MPRSLKLPAHGDEHFVFVIHAKNFAHRSETSRRGPVKNPHELLQTAGKRAARSGPILMQQGTNVKHYICNSGTTIVYPAVLSPRSYRGGASPSFSATDLACENSSR